MAHADLVGYCGFGAAISNDVLAYSTATNVSLTGGKVRITTGGNPVLARSRFSTAGETYHFVLIEFSYNQALSASAVEDICGFQLDGLTNPGQLQIVQNTDTTHFLVRLARGVTAVCTGTNDYATSTTHTFLAELDGTNWRLHYWNGSAWSEEASGAQGDKLGSTGASNSAQLQGRGGTLGASESIDLRAVACGSDNRDASPDGNMAFAASYPNANHTQQYGDDADCSVGSTSGTYTDVDTWATTTANDSDFICEQGGEAGRFLAEFTNPTIPTGMFLVMLRGRARANVGSKTVKTYLTISDGTTHVDRENGNLGTTGWTALSAGFPTDGNGDPWTQARWDAAKGGVLSDAGNGANDQWSEFAAELVGVGNAALPDTGAAASSRRRVLHQVAG